MVHSHLPPQLVHSHLPSATESRSSILPRWFTFIYRPQLVHSYLSSPSDSQSSTKQSWFIVIYTHQVVHNHLPSSPGSQPSILPKWFTVTYHPKLVHSHLPSKAGSVIYPPQVVHNRLPTTAGPHASNLPNWFTASYLPRPVESPNLSSWFIAALPSRFSLMPCENLGPSNVAPVGPSRGKKPLKGKKCTKRADFWKTKTQISCSVNSVKNSPVCWYYLFLFNDILSGSNYVASSHTIFNIRMNNELVRMWQEKVII